MLITSYFIFIMIDVKIYPTVNIFKLLSLILNICADKKKTCFSDNLY